MNASETSAIVDDGASNAPSPESSRNETTRDRAPASAPTKLNLLSTALSCKAPLDDLSSWTAASLTLDGRDKVTKILQYACRLMVWWLGRTARASSPVSLSEDAKKRNEIATECYRSLYKSLAEARKAYRLGRTVAEVHKIFSSAPPTLDEKKALGNETSPKGEDGDDDDEGSRRRKRLRAQLRLVCLAGYWTSDNVAYLSSVGFLESYETRNVLQRSATRTRRRTRASKNSARFFFLASVLALYEHLKDLFVAGQRLRRAWSQHRMSLVDAEVSRGSDTADADAAQSRNELDRAKKLYVDCVVSLTKSSCDAIVFGNSPGVDLPLKFRGRRMDEGIHCVLGIVSGLMVLYKKLPNKQ